MYLSFVCDKNIQSSFFQLFWSSQYKNGNHIDLAAQQNMRTDFSYLTLAWQLFPSLSLFLPRPYPLPPDSLLLQTFVKPTLYFPCLTILTTSLPIKIPLLCWHRLTQWPQRLSHIWPAQAISGPQCVREKIDAVEITGHTVEENYSFAPILSSSAIS